MPVFKVQSPDGKVIKIEASDQETAIRGAKEHYASLKRAKPSMAADVGKSALSGLREGAAGIADMVLQAGPIGAVDSALKGAANIATMIRTGRPQSAPTPISTFSDDARRRGYTPQTVAGAYAKTAGQMVPNAIFPGSVAARAANVVVPAITSETAGQVARVAGAGEAGQNVARAVGGLAGGLGASVRRGAKAPRVKPAAAPSLDDLVSAKETAYRAVDESGVRFSPEAFGDLRARIAKSTTEARINSKLHPKSAAMVEYLDKLDDQSPSLSDLDDIRKVIGRDLSSSPDKGERRMGEIMRGQIDDFIANARPDQLVGGDPAVAGPLLQRARDLNSRVEKLRSLDNLDEASIDRAAATGTGGNSGNASRQNMIRFQNTSKNLTPDERAATRRAIRGSATQNALRAVGSLSPEGGTVRAVASIGTGAVSGGALPAVGFVAKRVSDAMAERNVQALREIIANGGVAAQEARRQLALPENAALMRQLSRALPVAAMSAAPSVARARQERR